MQNPNKSYIAPSSTSNQFNQFDINGLNVQMRMGTGPMSTINSGMNQAKIKAHHNKTQSFVSSSDRKEVLGHNGMKITNSAIGKAGEQILGGSAHKH